MESSQKRVPALWLLLGAMMFGGVRVVGPQSSGAAGDSTNRAVVHQQVDEKAAQWLKEYDVPRVAVAYIEDRKIAWTAGYGEQSPGVAASENTLYDVASLTKPVTAEMILRLASAGKLSLDESISPYWRDPDIKDIPWSKELTARLCLSHQTRFTNWRYQTNGELTMQWEPGTRTGYSGEGYNYVGRYAEKKTGQAFEDLEQETVFAPIGMKDTAYTARKWFAGRTAVALGPRGEPEIQIAKNWTGADSLRTTVGDYAKFVVSVMHNEWLTPEIAAKRLVSTRNQATTEEVKRLCEKAKQDPAYCALSAGMGLGWQVVKHNDVTILDHTGSDPGVKTVAFYLPEKKIGVVALTSGENGQKVIHEVVRVLYPDEVLIATL